MEARMSDGAPRPPRAGGEADELGWDAEAVRRLRGHLRATQAELADQLGTRQQTVSEWETGASTPRRMSRRLLHLVAESSGFYDASAAPDGAPSAVSAGADEPATADGEAPG